MKKEEQKQHLIDMMKDDEDLVLYKKEKQKTTLEEKAEEYEYTDGIYGFKAGAKWQQERSYSEEDMLQAFESAREFNSLDGVVDIHIVLSMGGDISDLQPLHFTFKEWFEQFKKK